MTQPVLLFIVKQFCGLNAILYLIIDFRENKDYLNKNLMILEQNFIAAFVRNVVKFSKTPNQQVFKSIRTFLQREDIHKMQSFKGFFFICVKLEFVYKFITFGW